MEQEVSHPAAILTVPELIGRVKMFFLRKQKKRFKEYLRSITGERSNELLAAHVLSPLTVNHPFLPFSASYRLLAHLANDIINNRRRRILEFGSGVSTVIMARLNRMNRLGLTIISVDSNAEWIEMQKETLAKEGLEGGVSFVYAPCVAGPYDFRGHNYWFDPASLDPHLADFLPDLVLVDAPMGSMPYARYGALPYLLDKLPECYSIFLDDTHRAEEKAIVKAWQSMIEDCRVYSFPSYAHISRGASFWAVPSTVTI